MVLPCSAWISLHFAIVYQVHGWFTKSVWASLSSSERWTALAVFEIGAAFANMIPMLTMILLFRNGKGVSRRLIAYNVLAAWGLYPAIEIVGNVFGVYTSAFFGLLLPVLPRLLHPLRFLLLSIES